MKKNGITEKKLAMILKEEGLERPSDQFSDQLTHSVLRKYEGRRLEEFKVSEWVGKLILGVLVSFNIIFLFYLIPFSIQPVLITSLVAFILGLWGLIGLIKRGHRSKIDSLT